MPSKTSNRNLRNNPYVLEELLGRTRHTFLGACWLFCWRWRSEITTIFGVLAGFGWLIHAITVTWTIIALTATGSALGLVPHSRRYLTGRFWCLVTRHRLQRVCFEERLHTRAGRLPLVLWIRPTEVGERAWIWCRAGICAEDFDAHTGEISAACYAREARVTKHAKHSQLVTIDVIRHDTLHANRMVAPRIIPGTVLERSDKLTAKSRLLASQFIASIPRWLRRMPGTH
jgi:hypothetical protein